MGLKSLRKADFITSVLVIAFGWFVTIRATQMPMTASYGGVKAHWYVAPALFPLIIGVSLILLGLILGFIAVKDGGLRTLVDGFAEKSKKKIDEKTIRVWVVAFALGSFIYVFIPKIDFVVSIATFLFFICAVFYSESPRVFKYLTRFFLGETAVLVILFVSGIADILIGIYPYTIDAAALVLLVVMNVYARRLMKQDGLSGKKINTVMWVSIITPLILCPVFRYLLLTPLPNEGIILDHMNLFYYQLKY